MARDRSRFTRCDLVREVLFGTVFGVWLVLLGLAVIALISAMPTLLGLAIARLS